MSACCGRRDTGMTETLLTKIAAAGVEVPAGARVRRGGPHGWRWQLSDRHGRPLDPPVGSSCSAATIAAASGVQAQTVLDDGEPARHIHGGEPCGWD